MFSSAGLFKNVPCPQGEDCLLPGCIFNHTSETVSEPTKDSVAADSVTTKRGDEDLDAARSLKKRRIVNDKTKEATSTGTVSPKPASNQFTKPKHREPVKLATSTRTVSPPAKRASTTAAKPNDPLPAKSLATKGPAVSKSAPQRDIIEQLVPRKLASPPTTFPTRVKLTKLLYAEYIRLNKLVEDSKDPEKDVLLISKPQIVKLVLDEEEKVAKETPSVYPNIIKLRITKLRAMKTLDPWKLERLASIQKTTPSSTQPSDINTVNKPVKTGLTPKQEIALLPRLLTPITSLAQHGYVPNPPTESEISEAAQGVATARNWEICDRCEARFQVFPERRESDGVLTTGGKCAYHWGRQRRPPKVVGQTVGTTPARWTCCGSDVGSAPCVEAASHVFKISDSKRLALVMPFERTPREGVREPETAVVFDCEMGYTSRGFELIRLTAASWPEGRELVDVLVRPLGEVIDLNSRFSGVHMEDWVDAVPYEDTGEPASKEQKYEKDGQRDANGAKKRLKIVSSPQRARELLFEHLTDTTPLIGHAIENDLNAVRICHPAIVDTVLLFPATRPLPMRMGLKVLVKKHLDMDIQTGGAQGHDSGEDARATGELVRFKLAQQWKDMQRHGWKLEDGKFVPPKQDLSLSLGATV